MRGCATCVELEQLLEKTADDHWTLVLRATPGAQPEVRAAKLATDEALARYKQHLETAHSQAASST